MKNKAVYGFPLPGFPAGKANTFPSVIPEVFPYNREAIQAEGKETLQSEQAMSFPAQGSNGRRFASPQSSECCFCGSSALLFEKMVQAEGEAAPGKPSVKSGMFISPEYLLLTGRAEHFRNCAKIFEITEDKDPLDKIIERINGKYKGEFTEADRVMIGALVEKLRGDTNLTNMALSSDPQIFRRAFFFAGFQYRGTGQLH